MADLPKESSEGDKKKREEEAAEAQQFSVRWQGSLFAPDTGDYEFIVRTENGVRLWVNDHETALIDAWVQSGPQTEHRAGLRLLGGRTYTIRLEMFRHKEKSASVHLLWKPPHLAESVIPARYLSPHWSPTVYVVQTPLPPDDRSRGFERGSGISKAWDEATTFAALDAATYVSEHLRELTQIKRDDEKRNERLRRVLREVRRTGLSPACDG